MDHASAPGTHDPQMYGSVPFTASPSHYKCLSCASLAPALSQHVLFPHTRAHAHAQAQHQAQDRRGGPPLGWLCSFTAHLGVSISLLMHVRLAWPSVSLPTNPCTSHVQSRTASVSHVLLPLITSSGHDPDTCLCSLLRSLFSVVDPLVLIFRLITHILSRLPLPYSLPPASL